jgi:hypothetical protein
MEFKKRPKFAYLYCTKVSFLSYDNILQNLEAVIDLIEITFKTRNYLEYVLENNFEIVHHLFRS